jgi:hypothetical protein
MTDGTLQDHDRLPGTGPHDRLNASVSSWRFTRPTHRSQHRDRVAARRVYLASGICIWGDHAKEQGCDVFVAVGKRWGLASPTNAGGAHPSSRRMEWM